MSDKSLFAVLLRSPWWISFAVAIAVGAAAYNLFPAKYANVGAVSGLPFAVIGAMALWRQWGKPSAASIDASLAALAAMSGREFSAALEAAYTQDGYTVARLAGNGADLAITRGGRTALVYSKRWKAATHGVEPLRELAALMTKQDAGQGIYVAVNALSEPARQFASRNSIRVLAGAELVQLIKAAPTPMKKPA
jgi:restriction system protein